MRTTKRISFDANDIPGGTSTVQRSVGIPIDEMKILGPQGVFRQTRVYVTLDDTDGRLRALLDLLRDHGADWGELMRDIHSADELMTARLLLVSPNGECEVNGGPKFGTTYDLAAACQQCGTGAQQTGPLIVGEEEVGNLQSAIAAETYFGDILVKDKLADALVDAGTTGLDLRGIFESTGVTQRRLPWRQIVPQRTLSIMSPVTTGLIRDEVCIVCRRNGYFQTSKQATRIAYYNADLHDVQDVNATWEWFGYSKLASTMRETLLAHPMLLVSPKVVRVMLGQGVTAFDFIPIRVQ